MSLRKNLLTAVLDKADNAKAFSKGLQLEPGRGPRSQFRVGDRTYEVFTEPTSGLRGVRDINIPGSEMRLLDISQELKAIRLDRGTLRRTRRVMFDQEFAKWKSAKFITDDQARALAQKKISLLDDAPASRLATRMESSVSVAEARRFSQSAINEAGLRRGMPTRKYGSVNELIADAPSIRAQAEAIRASGIPPKYVMGDPKYDLGGLSWRDKLKTFNEIKTSRELSRFFKENPGYERAYNMLLLVASAGLWTGIGFAIDSASAARTTPTAASAAASAAASNPNSGKVFASEAEVGTFIDDVIQVALLEGAIAHQRKLNGCFLYDSIRGTMTKLHLLSCGNALVDEAMETCITRGGFASVDDVKNACPDNTFSPCLNPLCTSLVYNGATPPVVSSGVTTQPACSADAQWCSSLCDSKSFKLPEHLELMCVNVSLETAYVDLMALAGANIQEMFPPVSPPSRPRKWRWWILLIAVSITATAIVWYRRRSKARLITTPTG